MTYRINGGLRCSPGGLPCSASPRTPLTFSCFVHIHRPTCMRELEPEIVGAGKGRRNSRPCGERNRLFRSLVVADGRRLSALIIGTLDGHTSSAVTLERSRHDLMHAHVVLAFPRCTSTLRLETARNKACMNILLIRRLRTGEPGALCSRTKKCVTWGNRCSR